MTTERKLGATGECLIDLSNCIASLAMTKDADDVAFERLVDRDLILIQEQILDMATHTSVMAMREGANDILLKVSDVIGKLNKIVGLDKPTGAAAEAIKVKP